MTTHLDLAIALVAVAVLAAPALMIAGMMWRDRRPRRRRARG